MYACSVRSASAAGRLAWIRTNASQDARRCAFAATANSNESKESTPSRYCSCHTPHRSAATAALASKEVTRTTYSTPHDGSTTGDGREGMHLHEADSVSGAAWQPAERGDYPVAH